MSKNEIKYWCAVRRDFCNRTPLQNCGRVLPRGAENTKDEGLLKLQGEPCPEAVADVTERLAKILHGGEKCLVDISKDGRSYEVNVLEDNSDENAVNIVGVQEGKRF